MLIFLTETFQLNGIFCEGTSERSKIHSRCLHFKRTCWCHRTLRHHTPTIRQSTCDKPFDKLNALQFNNFIRDSNRIQTYTHVFVCVYQRQCPSVLCIPPIHKWNWSVVSEVPLSSPVSKHTLPLPSQTLHYTEIVLIYVHMFQFRLINNHHIFISNTLVSVAPRNEIVYVCARARSHTQTENEKQFSTKNTKKKEKKIRRR